MVHMCSTALKVQNIIVHVSPMIVASSDPPIFVSCPQITKIHIPVAPKQEKCYISTNQCPSLQCPLKDGPKFRAMSSVALLTMVPKQLTPIKSPFLLSRKMANAVPDGEAGELFEYCHLMKHPNTNMSVVFHQQMNLAGLHKEWEGK